MVLSIFGGTTEKEADACLRLPGDLFVSLQSGCGQHNPVRNQTTADSAYG